MTAAAPSSAGPGSTAGEEPARPALTRWRPPGSDAILGHVSTWEPILRDATAGPGTEPDDPGSAIWSADVGDRVLEVLDLTVTYETAPDDVADALGTDRVLLRDRVYAVDGRRVCWARSYLPAGIVAGSLIELPETAPGGTPARLAELGHGPADFVEDVAFADPAAVEPQERGRLDIDGSTPVARIVRYTADAEGRPIEVTDLRLVAGAFRFRWAWSMA